MKVKKYPKWKKLVICNKCATEYYISSKDIIKGKIRTSNYPLGCYKAYSYCPFCKEQIETKIAEFFNEENEEE